MTVLPVEGRLSPQRRAMLMRRLRWLVAGTITYNVSLAGPAVN